jgi:sec-independent protein translocase protein TatA
MLSSTLLFLSAPDITIILVVALVLFGGKKLPELARGLGQGIREFKDATDGVKSDIQNQVNKEPEPVAPVTPPAPAAPVAPPVPIAHVEPTPAVHTEPKSDLPEYTPVNQGQTPPAGQ